MLALLAGGAAGAPSGGASAERSGFIGTGSMTVIRNRLIAAAPLPTGEVLVAGGEDMNPWASAELYQPASGSFSAMGVGTMSTPREESVAAPLPNGDALIVGGNDAQGHYLLQGEVFDPATRRFSAAGVGSLTQPRTAAAAAPLPDGRVLIVGGFDGGRYLSTAEIFDPKTMQFSSAGVGSMSTGRWGLVAAPLPDGSVLVAGGQDNTGGILQSAEIFDPATGLFSSTGIGPMTSPRVFATATPLSNGEVLIAGGLGTGGGQPLATAEIFDPATNTFSSAGLGTMAAGRMQAAGAPLPNGRALLAGGAGPAGELSSAEIFTPAPNATATALSARVTIHTTSYIVLTLHRQGRAIKVRRRTHVVRVARATPIFTATPASTTVTRGNRVYATGSALLTRLVLHTQHALQHGSYVLTIRRPYGHRTLTTRRRWVIS
jgi:hypothetical protein